MKLSLAMIGQEGGDALMIELLDRIGRHRALADDESQLLEKLVRRERARIRPQRTTHKWTRDEDRELLRVQYRRRGVAELAIRNGVTEAAAWSRVQALRHPHKRRVKPILVEG